MSRKNTKQSKSSVEVQAEAPVVVAPVVAPAPVVEAVAPKRKQRKPAEPVVVAPAVVEPVVVEEVLDVQEGGAEKHRRTQTKESVLADFDAVLEALDREISQRREGGKAGQGTGFLRKHRRQLNILRNNTQRVMKSSKKTTRKNNTNSGFLKPVTISTEMAKFTGWSPEEQRSRVDVTKFICDYIREHNLQNPADKRQINPDKKLSALLKYDAKSDDKPLTYYRIQTYMKPHFKSSVAA
jgi:chromatin remodeling complex protein RSC6